MTKCAQKGFINVRHVDPVRCKTCESPRMSLFLCRTCNNGFCESCMEKHARPTQPGKDPNHVATPHDSSR